MLVTQTHTSEDRVTGEVRTKTVEMRAKSLGLPDDFVPDGEGKWIRVTETRLSVHEHIVTVTHKEARWMTT